VQHKLLMVNLSNINLPTVGGPCCTSNRCSTAARERLYKVQGPFFQGVD